MIGLNPIQTFLFMDGGSLAFLAAAATHMCFGAALVAAICRRGRMLVRFMFWGWVLDVLIMVAAGTLLAGTCLCLLPYEWHLLGMYNSAVRAIIVGLSWSLVVGGAWFARSRQPPERRMIAAIGVIALLALAALLGLNRWCVQTLSWCDFRPAPRFEKRQAPNQVPEDTVRKLADPQH